MSKAADPPGWRLAWSDDFDALDLDRWHRVETYQPTNNSRQAYLPQQVSVSDGKLVILAEDTPAGGLPYRSGQVISHASQKHGRWEIRAKLPTSTGMWPAIWLLPDVQQHPWPTGGEIDIMENRGTQPTLTSSAFHYGSRTPYQHDFVYETQQTAQGGQLANYHTSFHTYAVDWTERYLKFYVDDVHYYTVHDRQVDGFLSGNVAPMQLVINNAIGGDFLDDPDSSTQWPQTMEIDWVRVYTPNPRSFTAVFSNPGFETQGGSLAEWTTFGNRLADNPNVRVASEAVQDGAASLKLFGDFVEGATYSGVSQGISVASGDTVTAQLSSFIRAADSIAGTGNTAILKIEFYSEFAAEFNSPEMLDVRGLTFATGESGAEVWNRHELTATAPEGAVEARLAIVFSQPQQEGGAVHVDDVFFNALSGAAAQGDFNADGVVDAADYAAWREQLGARGTRLAADADGDGVVTAQDYQIWRSNFGSGPASASPANPAPATTSATLACVAALLNLRQRVPPSDDSSSMKRTRRGPL